MLVCDVSNLNSVGVDIPLGTRFRLYYYTKFFSLFSWEGILTKYMCVPPCMYVCGGIEREKCEGILGKSSSLYISLFAYEMWR